MPDGTDNIADKFNALSETQKVRFSAPEDAVKGWLPDGYCLVTDPNHLLMPDDCILHFLSNNWRLVSTVEAGARAGKPAKDAGAGIVYVATHHIEQE